jgi:tetratricopeptide (TPR) repeat protein
MEDEPEVPQPIVVPAETRKPIDVVESRKLAEQALEDGRIDVAYDHARIAHQNDPDDPTVMYVMARVLGERHRYDEAIGMLDSVAQKDPQARLPTLGQTAQWMVLKGDWVGAEERYRTILEEVPDIAMVHEEIAKLLLRQGRRDNAATHLRELCRSGVVKEEWMLELLSISIGLNRMIGGDEEEPIGVLGIAQNLVAKGKRGEAMKRLRDHHQQTAVVEQAFLGRLLALENDQEKLRVWFEDFVIREESTADAWFASATWHQMIGEHATAVVGFCKAVQRDSTDDSAYQRMGESLRELALGANANLALKRAAKIRRTKSLGRQIAQSAGSKFDRINELVQLLEELQRKDEALAWKTLAIANSGRPKEEIQQAILNVNSERLDWLSSESLDPDSNFILCGLDLEELPN